MKNIFVLLFVLMTFLLNSCFFSDDSDFEQEDPAPTVEELEKDLKATYFYWADATVEHSYSKAISVSLPGSNFEGRTKVCKRQWDSGVELYFTRLKITKVTMNDDNTATITGTWEMIQNEPGANFELKLRSSAVYIDEEWLLDGCNDNETIRSW